MRSGAYTVLLRVTGYAAILAGEGVSKTHGHDIVEIV